MINTKIYEKFNYFVLVFLIIVQFVILYLLIVTTNIIIIKYDFLSILTLIFLLLIFGNFVTIIDYIVRFLE